MKKLLLSLLWIITLWLINFWNCADYTFYDYDQEYPVDSSMGTISFDLWTDFYNSPVFCVDTMQNYWQWNLSVWWSNFNINPWTITCYVFLNWVNYSVQLWNWWAFVRMYFDASTIDNDFSSSCDYSQYETQINTLSWNLTTCQSDLATCQNSSSCDYSWYILESEINSWYCLVNWLCPSSEICNDSDYSNLFIYSNNRYFSITWTNNIYVNLPSYLWYDYDYSNGWNDLDIDVWMVVDEDYIDWLNAVHINFVKSSEVGL